MSKNTSNTDKPDSQTSTAKAYGPEADDLEIMAETPVLLKEYSCKHLFLFARIVSYHNPKSSAGISKPAATSEIANRPPVRPKRRR